MKTVGIICEYNPFHNGHKFHMEKAKEMTGCDNVVCVMSGSISQRGEVCVFDKWKRAEDAVRCGADLVIELPEYYVLQGADIFSYGAVKLLESLGVVDCISFGSESGDIDLLKKVARVTMTEEYNRDVRMYMDQGKSYPVSCSLSLKKMCDTELKANDMLGVSYIRALGRIKSDILPYCIKRESVEHNSDMANGEFASASYIRKLLLEGKISDAEKLVPYKITDDTKIYNEEKMYNIIRYVVSNLSDYEFSRVKGIEPGLNIRIKKALESSNCLEKFYDNAVTSRYTISRIRRLVKCAMLNIDTNAELSYIRLLAFNDNGRKLIKEIKEKSSLPVISKLADYSNEDIMLEWDVNATALSTYCIDNPDEGPDDYRVSPVYVKQK